MFGYRILVQITNSRVPSTVLARSTSPSPAEGNRLLHVLRCRARLIACGRRTAGSHPAGHCPSERRHLAEAAPGARRRRDPIGRGERRHLAPFHTATMLSLSRVVVLLLSTGGARLAGHRQPAPAATTPRSRGCGSRRRATTPRPGTRRATCCRNTATRSWTTRARLRTAEIHCCRDLPRKSRSRREDLPPRRPSQRLQGTGDVNDGPALRVLLRPATGTQEEWLQAQKWPTDAEANPCDGEWRSWCVAWV
jgi:hypothetical protein